MSKFRALGEIVLAKLFLGIALFLTLTLTSCTIPQVKAEDRLFLDLSVDFLGEYILPKQQFANTLVGGLSGIVYDRQRDRLYAVSDDRSDRAPARFYTLQLKLKPSIPAASESLIQSVEIESVTTLMDANGQPFAKGTLDPEGIALTPRQSVFISSEGVSKESIDPFVNEFDLESGQQRSILPIPTRFLPISEGSGVQDNQGFESLTLSAVSFQQELEPFRLFTATEAALQQDLLTEPSPSPSSTSNPIRFLHYLIGGATPTLIAEHLYLPEPPPAGAQSNGLSELLILDQAGHFLSLERSFGTAGINAKLFQMVPAGATDTSGFDGFQGNISGITPLYKELLLDLTTLGIALDNLEGMTLGPQLPDGSQSLLLVSDDNFNELQVTQFLLFRLNGLK